MLHLLLELMHLLALLRLLRRSSRRSRFGYLEQLLQLLHLHHQHVVAVAVVPAFLVVADLQSALALVQLPHPQLQLRAALLLLLQIRRSGLPLSLQLHMIADRHLLMTAIRMPQALHLPLGLRDGSVQRGVLRLQRALPDLILLHQQRIVDAHLLCGGLHSLELVAQVLRALDGVRAGLRQLRLQRRHALLPLCLHRIEARYLLQMLCLLIAQGLQLLGQCADIVLQASDGRHALRLVRRLGLLHLLHLVQQLCLAKGGLLLRLLVVVPCLLHLVLQGGVLLLQVQHLAVQLLDLLRLLPQQLLQLVHVLGGVQFGRGGAGWESRRLFAVCGMHGQG